MSLVREHTLLDESNVSILRDGDLVCIGGSAEEVVGDIDNVKSQVR